MLKSTAIVVMMMFMNNSLMFPACCILIVVFNIHASYSDTAKISYILMGDSLSLWTVNLTLWIILLTMMVKTNSPKTSAKLNSAMTMTLSLAFTAWNFTWFFVLFEMSMVLIAVTVMVWGYQPERGEAVLFMLIMTSLFSLPFFVNLMVNFNQTHYWLLKDNLIMWEYLSFMIIFMVKMPTYFIHIWLPKVHVEAPVQGSMILAAIMLKLGCYGMLRLAPAMVKLTCSYQSAIMSFGLWSAVVLSMTTTIQPDLKSLVAYSSVVHMTLTFLAITMLKQKPAMASLLIMIGHGLCSSALFLMCNMMYKQSKSRSVMINKSNLSTTPAVMMIWFFLCMSNIPMPPSINIMGELLIFKSITNWSSLTLLIVLSLMIMSSYYSTILFYTPSHGQPSPNIKAISMSSKNLLNISLHLIPLMAITMKSSVASI